MVQSDHVSNNILLLGTNNSRLSISLMMFSH